MFLHHLELTDYRNYQTLVAEFDAHKAILLGDNAQGKTNILEAIGLLATGKSPVASKDADLVRWGADQAIIRARATRELSDVAVDMLIRTTGRRAMKVNGLGQKRVADVLGKILVVLFRSEDLLLVKGGPAERRAYLDTMLVQLGSTHYTQLHDYQRVVTQRNHALRALSEGGGDRILLETYDDQLVGLALAIWKRRIALMRALEPRVAAAHQGIAEGKEALGLVYRPSVALGDDEAGWEAALRAAIEESRRKEIARGQSLVGPHRDDLELLIDGRPAKIFGSQGQQRTAVLALKLAELEHIRAATGESPLLLLDDVLAELDVRRQNALLGSIGAEVQTFVTSTHLNDFSAAWLEQAAIYTVRSGLLLKSKS